MNSPVIVKSDINPSEMDFYHALALAVEGKKMHKLEWKDKEYYGFFKDERLMLHKPDGSLNDWMVRDADVVGTDWIII